MGSANWRRVNATSSLIGWAHTKNDSSVLVFVRCYLWWGDDMDTFSSLFTLCEANSFTIVDSPHKALVQWSFCVSVCCQTEQADLWFTCAACIIRLLNYFRALLKFTNRHRSHDGYWCSGAIRPYVISNIHVGTVNMSPESYYAATTHVSDSTMASSNGTFSVSLALCEGNPTITGGFSSQRPVTQSFDIFFIYAWTNNWANADDLRHHRARYDVAVMSIDIATHIMITSVLH